MQEDKLASLINKTLNEIPIVDMHTHLFPYEFNEFCLYGIDNILTYHYLIAEYFRFQNTSSQFFWTLAKENQAELIWKTLFIDNTPLTESTIGVLKILNELGISFNKSLNVIRSQFDNIIDGNPKNYIEKILTHSNVKKVVMTNDPLDINEIKFWNESVFQNKRFKFALRLDSVCKTLIKDINIQLFSKNYSLKRDISNFLTDLIEKTNPEYLSISLPDHFNFDGQEMFFLNDYIFPLLSKYNLPIVFMIGVRRKVNVDYHSAGDGVGKFNIIVLEKLCKKFRSIKFFVTLLSRENQHELAVLARKFSNLIPFGSWWFLNNLFNSTEIGEMRTSLLGNSFVFQHSDSRVIEHLIYKWNRSKEVLSEILLSRYSELIRLNYPVTKKIIKRDAYKFLNSNYQENINN